MTVGFLLKRGDLLQICAESISLRDGTSVSFHLSGWLFFSVSLGSAQSCHKQQAGRQTCLLPALTVTVCTSAQWNKKKLPTRAAAQTCQLGSCHRLTEVILTHEQLGPIRYLCKRTQPISQGIKIKNS